MNFHDILDALGNKETLRGYFGSFLTIVFGVITLEHVQTAIAVAGGFFGICLTIISIYIKAQEMIKNKLEIRERKQKLNHDPKD